MANGYPDRVCRSSYGITMEGRPGEATSLIVPGHMLGRFQHVHITQIWASVEPATNARVHLTVKSITDIPEWDEYTRSNSEINRYFISPLEGPEGENMVVSLDAVPGSVGTISVTYFLA